jgi:hypothetical protein
MPSLSPTELTRIEPIVASSFLPNERLIRICREDPGRLLQRQAARFLVPVVLLFIVFAVRGSHLALPAALLLIFSILLVFFVLFNIRTRTAFAITDKRILILLLPDGLIKGWINLDRLSAIEIENSENGVGDIRIRFSSRPSGARRSPKGKSTNSFDQLPMTDFALKGVERPEELKGLMESIPRHF